MGFKVGDIVFLKKDSEHMYDYDGARDSANPFNVQGKIISIDSGDEELPIEVRWITKLENNYHEKDLELLVDKKLSDYIEDIRLLAINKKWIVANKEFVVEHFDYKSIIIRVNLVGLAIENLDGGFSGREIERWINEVIHFNFKSGQGDIKFNW